MKKIVVFIILIYPLTVLSQKIKKSDLIGEWRVIKTAFLENDQLIRQAYIDKTLNSIDSIKINGPDLGEMNKMSDSLINAAINSKFIFQDNDTFNYHICIKDLEMKDKYWTLIIDSNEIVIKDWQHKDENLNLLMSYTIVKFENGILSLFDNDSGQEIKYDLIKIK